MDLKMTRRASLVAVAGLASALLLGGISPASAQPTQEGLKDKGKAAVKKGRVSWEAMTPEQQEAMKTNWKMDAEKSKAKWDAMTPEQQDKAISQAKGLSKEAKAKWQSLPKQ